MNVAEINFDEDRLMPVGIETLRGASELPFDLYLPGEGRSRLVLYRNRRHAIADSDLERLMQRGVRTLYIAQGDSTTYREYLRDTFLKNDGRAPRLSTSTGSQCPSWSSTRRTRSPTGVQTRR